ncbi:MAG: phosphomannomutase/phosphoglucomutase [Planctomycetota bacterium]|nr:MAG: phosphomannomutase/phosphoglucomutase [Planctomycetota bacterium]
MDESIFKAYDIRGVVPDTLDEDAAERIGVACGSFLTERSDGPIVVGRDMRASSPALAGRLIAGLRAAGADVVDVGRVDTPFVTFAINHVGAAGGVMVTASHNPPQYNGFKVSGPGAAPVGRDTGLETIRQRALAASVGGAPVGSVEARDLWDAYAEHVRRFLDEEGLAARPVRVVVDASNAMAGAMVPRVFGGSIAGLTIDPINFENESGVFAHEPNPLVPENLRDLQRAVRERGGDLGVCFDGDADRCVVVDEAGAIVGCDILTAWLSRGFLRESPGAAVVYDLRSSKAVEEEIRAAGGEPVRSRVGHVFMKTLMRERGGVFGGELSGHFYFRDNFCADSGAIAMATVLSALARAGEPLSACLAPIARYAQSGEINFRSEDKDAALAIVRETYAKRGSIDELDGVTVDCFDAEGWWANIRKSNTEPLLRLNLEARSRDTMRSMVEEIAPLLGERVDH